MDQAQRFTNGVLTRDGMLYIADAVGRTRGSALSQNDITELFHYAKQMAGNTNWTRYSTDQMRAAVVAAYMARAATLETDDDNVDSHESNKSRLSNGDNSTALAVAGRATVSAPDASATPGPLDVATLFGKSDSLSLQTAFNPKATLRRNYIEFDSRFRDTSQDVAGSGITRFVWSFLSNSSQNATGVVNSTGNVNQIHSIATSNLRVPYYTCQNDYQRVTLLVNELGGQSYIAQEGRNYHFMYSSEVDRAQVNLRAMPREHALFEFARPITQLDTLTLTFANPHELITFDMDRQFMTVGYTTAATFSSVLAHNLETGAVVYISDFTTGSPAADSVSIVATMRSAGWNITVTSSTSFQVPGLDLSLLTAPIAGQTANVFFGSKRLFVPMELVYYMHPV